jgi:hypothetical protein
MTIRNYAAEVTSCSRAAARLSNQVECDKMPMDEVVIAWLNNQVTSLIERMKNPR